MHLLRPARYAMLNRRAKTISRKVSYMERNLKGTKRAIGAGATGPRFPRAHIISVVAAPPTDLSIHQFTTGSRRALLNSDASAWDSGPWSLDFTRAAAEALRQGYPKSPVELPGFGIKPRSSSLHGSRCNGFCPGSAHRNCNRNHPNPITGVTDPGPYPAALLLPIESSAPLTQMHPGLAQSNLTYGAKILTQSDRFQPNLSQRVFRQTFRPNLTYRQIRVGSCPIVVDVSAPMLLPNVPASSRSKQALTRSDKAKQASKKCANKACYKCSLSTLRSQIADLRLPPCFVRTTRWTSFPVADDRTRQAASPFEFYKISLSFIAFLSADLSTEALGKVKKLRAKLKIKPRLNHHLTKPLQGSGTQTQACARSGKPTQASKENAQASLACKPSRNFPGSLSQTILQKPTRSLQIKGLLLNRLNETFAAVKPRAPRALVLSSLLAFMTPLTTANMAAPRFTPREKQVTSGPGGRILTNTGVWSLDSEWIVYDTRSDADGTGFDGTRIEKVNVRTGQVKVLYESKNRACCGIATHHPRLNKVVFILGPENPTLDWSYGPAHRQGVIIDEANGNQLHLLDARDVVAPFTPGALRGGSHVHVFSGDGQWLSFTYNDHVLSRFQQETTEHELDLRNVGVSVPVRAVTVKKDHPRNHDGEYFSVLATRTTAHPKPGSDEISKAFEDAWVGTNGYLRKDGKHRSKALAFQGNITTEKGETISEVCIVDLPEDVTRAGEGPLEGTETRRPFPPKGTAQRRLTFTAHRKFPGIQGPRHWLRSSPDGTRIAFLMKDDAGVVQVWTVSPTGGEPTQVTRNGWPVASAFSWSSDGHWIAHVMDNSVAITEVTTGKTTRLTARTGDASAPRPEACVFSPDGKRIAFVRRLPHAGREHNQICVLSCDL
ncbi:MAG: biopolymer transporter Tol [Verrucomicrobiales bacterium]|nr:biopolymer transporter Tol [Verrucomicrobiales bacterium]